MTGLSAASIWKVEKEVTVDPGYATIANICKALGVTIQEVLTAPTVDDPGSRMQAMFAALPPSHQQAMLITVEQLLASAKKK